jgi:hypothetical protein
LARERGGFLECQSRIKWVNLLNIRYLYHKGIGLRRVKTITIVNKVTSKKINEKRIICVTQIIRFSLFVIHYPSKIIQTLESWAIQNWVKRVILQYHPFLKPFEAEVLPQ